MDMDMGHLELRDDDSDAGVNANTSFNTKPSISGLRNSGAQRNGTLTRFSGYRGS